MNTLQFNNITLSDQEDITAFLHRYGNRGCEQTFASMFCWKDAYPTQVCRYDGLLLLRFCGSGRRMTYLLPFDDARYLRLLPLVQSHAEAHGEVPLFHTGTTKQTACIREALPGYGAFYHRADSDYIYLRTRLATLSGSHLQAKRNLSNQFKAQYAFVYAPLTAADGPACLQLLEKWQQQKAACHALDDALRRELDMEARSIRTAMAHFDTLGLLGGAIRVEDRLVAFCIGAVVTDDTVDVLFEKADEHFHGLFQTINQQFAAHLPEQYVYINRENDMGLNGLRKAKESYHPEQLLHKPRFAPMTPLMQQVESLWLQAFPDDTPEDAEQFLLTCFREDRMLAACNGDRLVSMLHMVPFGPSVYFYAIATHPDFRHRGLGSGLVRQALEQCRTQGFKEAVLIPDSAQAAEWYGRMGFAGSHSVRFNPADACDDFALCNGYDYGKGDGTPDLAMVCPLSDDAPQHTGELLLTTAPATAAGSPCTAPAGISQLSSSSSTKSSC